MIDFSALKSFSWHSLYISYLTSNYTRSDYFYFNVVLLPHNLHDRSSLNFHLLQLVWVGSMSYTELITKRNLLISIFCTSPRQLFCPGQRLSQAEYLLFFGQLLWSWGLTPRLVLVMSGPVFVPLNRCYTELTSIVPITSSSTRHFPPKRKCYAWFFLAILPWNIVGKHSLDKAK